jgi:hypothetical protein
MGKRSLKIAETATGQAAPDMRGFGRHMPPMEKEAPQEEQPAPDPL